MLKTSVASIAIAATAAAAHAGEVVQGGSVPLTPTDWSQSIMIDQFDTMGGLRNLLEVEWSISGSIFGVAEIESLDAEPVTVTATMRADLSASLAGVSLTTISPEIAGSFDADPFDGVIDFSGPSGAVIGPMGDVVNIGGVSPADAMYEGTGQIPLWFEAIGSAWTTGSGNLVTSFTTESSVEYEVIYRYQVVPAPGGAGAALIAGLALARRRRR